ncbi:FR47 domain-containing protein [Trichostrongylus colubriformis]|uniref:Glycine N-acyltransferase-like protein n=1 Tax=Trichostrongylus colubriformis TaxID=6319 RepID=A0AAN8EQ90_TRICO
MRPGIDTGEEGEEEETRFKLKAFPSSCVRYEGKPVAFEMVSQAGQLTALYVQEQHRGKGLGRIVELDLCQKVIRFGLYVIKCVELFNTSLLSSTSRLPYWTKVMHDDGSDFLNVFYKLEMK